MAGITYEVGGAHRERDCHPETCCCPTEYVLIKREASQGGLGALNKSIVCNLEDEKQGSDLVSKLLSGEITEENISKFGRIVTKK